MDVEPDQLDLWRGGPRRSVDPPTAPREPAKPTIEERFWRFHLANPDVYVELRALARSVKAAGYERWSIGAAWEVLRWQRMMRTNDPSSDRKLNDHFRSRYARLLMQEPDLATFFEVRELRSA